MERRCSKRVDSVNLVTIASLDENVPLQGVQLARTLNISREGAAIKVSSSSLSVPVDTHLQLQIALGERIVNATARVVRANQLSENEITLGVLFTALSPDDRQTIADLIRNGENPSA